MYINCEQKKKIGTGKKLSRPSNSSHLRSFSTAPSTVSEYCTFQRRGKLLVVIP